MGWRIDLDRVPGAQHFIAIAPDSREVSPDPEQNPNAITESMARLYAVDLLRRGLPRGIVLSALDDIGSDGQRVKVQEPAHFFDNLAFLENVYFDTLDPCPPVQPARASK